MNKTAAQFRPEESPQTPQLRAVVTGDSARFAATGSWTVHDFEHLAAEIDALRIADRRDDIATAQVDLAGVDELDTAGALLIDQMRRELEICGIPTEMRVASEKQGVLLGVVRENAARESPRPQRAKARASFAGDAVAGFFEAMRDAVRLTGFLGEVTVSAVRTALHPWRFRWISFIHHIEYAGLRAVPIIALICVLVGAVITQQGIVQLREFRAEPLAIDMLGILALREVGILLTAIVVAGRSASAFTAEIGSMKMREEIDAMRALGIEPMETLVLPRIAALIVILPILAFIGDIMCLAGGAAMAMLYLDIDIAVYVQRLHDAISLRHFVVGLVKAPLVAMIIGLVGCREGLCVRGSAESLGTHVTSAVVKAIFLVIVFDALFAMFLSASGY